MRRSTAGLAAAAALLTAAGCAGGGTPTGSPGEPTPTGTAAPAPTSQHPEPTLSATTGPTTSAEPTADPGTVPPPWLGTRALPTTAAGFGEVRPTPPSLRNRRFTLPDTVAMLPGRGFASRVVSPAPDHVIGRSTWESACPVDRDQLAWLRVRFRGFDGERHTGELLVHAAAADDLVEVFRDLWEADFPIEQMRITTPADLDAPPTGDGNGTEVFVCRPVTGGSSYSQHAYGLAIDVNSFQNPYVKGNVVLPELASAYLDRGNVRPGMILAGDPVVRAFAAIGWEWGGDWNSLKDYQHFSHNGR